LVPPAHLLAIKGERASAEIEQAGAGLAARGLVVDVVCPRVLGVRLGTVVSVLPVADVSL